MRVYACTDLSWVSNLRSGRRRGTKNRLSHLGTGMSYLCVEQTFNANTLSNGAEEGRRSQMP